MLALIAGMCYSPTGRLMVFIKSQGSLVAELRSGAAVSFLGLLASPGWVPLQIWVTQAHWLNKASPKSLELSLRIWLPRERKHAFFASNDTASSLSEQMSKELYQNQRCQEDRPHSEEGCEDLQPFNEAWAKGRKPTVPHKGLGPQSTGLGAGMWLQEWKLTHAVAF